MSGLYVKLDAEYASDDKLIEAGPMAELLYIRGLAFAKRTMTDGDITRRQLAAVGLGIPNAVKHAQRLVEAGAWHETPTGWRIASWLKRNPSVQQIEADREAKRVASMKGNHEQHHVGPGKKPSHKCELCRPKPDPTSAPTSEPNRIPKRLQEEEPEPEEEPKPQPEPEPEPEPSSVGSVNGSKTDPTPEPPEDLRIRSALAAIVTQRINGNPKGDKPAYRRAVEADVRTTHLVELQRLAARYPTAPADVLAASAQGDKHSLANYAEGTPA